MALSFRRLVGRVAVGALAVAVPVVLTPPPASAAPTELFFSEYIEGSSNNKAVEIYNGTGVAVDLSGGGYVVQVYANGAAAPTSTISLLGSVVSGDVRVLANTASSAAILAQADQTSGSLNHNGNDTVVLRKGGATGAILDVFGQVGVDPGAAWGAGTATTTVNSTLRRKTAVQAGDTNPADAFDPAAQWDGFPVDTVDGLGAYGDALPPDDAPTVTAVSPTTGSTVAVGSQVTVTFSEDVSAPASAFALSCNGTPVAFALTGGPTTFTLDPSADLPFGASCSATVTGASVSDTDTNDPPDTVAADRTWAFSTAEDIDRCALPATTIGSVQGSGETSPAAGQTRTVRGVVVADLEGPQPALRGFYVQDTGDGDAGTSDAIFVFDSGADLVTLGDVVTVTGPVSEFEGQTQISSTAVNIAVCGTGTATPASVSLPLTSATDLEKYEGMLVRFAQPLVVTEHFLLGRFGQVTMSGGERLDVPTNVVAPGPPAIALQAQNNLNKILVDDTSNAQNADPVFGRGGQPLTATNTLRGGDTLPSATGVLTYTWGGNVASPNAYRLRPVANGALFDFQPTNPRPDAREDVGGDVQVGAMNLLNLFNTFTNCSFGVGAPPTTSACRGANNAVEYERQVAKTVTAITKVNADVLGVNEIENDGYADTSAIAELVTRLNAGRAPADTYAFINPDTTNGVNSLGTDAIKVGMLYKPALVTPIGRTATLNTVAFVNGGDNAPRSRPSLAQAFRVNETGGTFVADVNHLKSKGSACNNGPDTGDGQGNCNVARTNAATELAAWLKSDPTGTGEADTLILGDLNSYAKEDPIRTLEEAGFTNLVAKYVGDDAYSYVFDGQWGYLDHALGSAGMLSQVTDVTEYHINADEPSVLDYNVEFKSAAQVQSLYAPNEFRVSDHDPIIVGLKPNSAPTVSAAFEDGSVACGTGNASLEVTFTDRDEADTHTATVAWGDGTPNTVVDPATSPLTLTHSYARAGRYTATVTVVDSHGLSATRTAVVAVEYTSSGVLAPLRSGGTAQLGSTVPVKVAYTDCDGSVPTDLDPVVTVTRNGTTHVTGTATLVKGEWKYELSTRRLAAGTYTVTVTVPETGQTDTAQLTLRR